MADVSPYSTPLALAQDVLTIKSGGAAPTDDENLQLRQVLYWISTIVAALYRQQVFESRGVTDRIDERLWQPVTMQLTERTQPITNRQPMPKTFASATLPADLLAWADQLLIKDVFLGREQLTQLPLDTVRQGSVGYSRFGQARSGWAVSGSTMYVSIPSTEDVDRSLTALMVKVPDYSGIIDNPDAPTPWPAEWNANIRQQVLSLLGATVPQVPDNKNNGADLQSDKR